MSGRKPREVDLARSRIDVGEGVSAHALSPRLAVGTRKFDGQKLPENLLTQLNTPPSLASSAKKTNESAKHQTPIFHVTQEQSHYPTPYPSNPVYVKSVVVLSTASGCGSAPPTGKVLDLNGLSYRSRSLLADEDRLMLSEMKHALARRGPPEGRGVPAARAARVEERTWARWT